jgi:protein-arginine kinase activator protein McsA
MLCRSCSLEEGVEFLFPDGSGGLCQDCAYKLRIPLDRPPMPLSDRQWWAAMLDWPFEFKNHELTQTLCSGCGTSTIEIFHTGLAGCPRCYIEHTQLIYALQSYLQDSWSGRASWNARIVALELAIQDACRCERYEEAGRLRDTLAALYPGDSE